MLTLYGISTCDTVRKARTWLDQRGLAYEWVDFRKSTLDPRRAARWVAAVGSKPLRNTSGGAYRALPIDKSNWDDTTWAAHFAADPMLIKRPVIERDGVVVQVGFRGTEEELQARLG